MKLYPKLFYLFILFISIKTIFAQNNFVTIPADTYEIIDGNTGIKVNVTVSEFNISRTEVTQKEFFNIMNYNPSYHKGQE